MLLLLKGSVLKNWFSVKYYVHAATFSRVLQYYKFR